MTKTKDQLKLKIKINKKVFQENAEKLKKDIQNLYQEYHALEHSYKIIADTLKNELKTVENQEKLTTTLTLPTPVYATTGQKQQTSGNNQNRQNNQIIDLTDTTELSTSQTPNKKDIDVQTVN
jgi:hypothetical protein